MTFEQKNNGDHSLTLSSLSHSVPRQERARVAEVSPTTGAGTLCWGGGWGMVSASLRALPFRVSCPSGPLPLPFPEPPPRKPLLSLLRWKSRVPASCVHSLPSQEQPRLGRCTCSQTSFFLLSLLYSFPVISALRYCWSCRTHRK